MSSSLLERARRCFSHPFRGFEGFFEKNKINYENVKKIKIPHDHELHNQVKTMLLIEFKLTDGFERQVVLIEDKQKNRYLVLRNKDRFQPNNRAPVAGCGGNGETLAHAVYGEASTVGRIEFIEDKSFVKADQSALKKAKELTGDCLQSGIKSDDVQNNIQLSGAHIVVISDPKKRESIDNMPNVIGFLFGPIGPFSDTIVFPGVEQQDLMDKIILAGGRTLLNGSETDPTYIISVQQFLELKESLPELNDANMARIPYLIHQFILINDDNEQFFEQGELFDYLKAELK